MALGFALALARLPLPAVEPMILASTVAHRPRRRLALRADLRACMAFVALFALFHGHPTGASWRAAGALRFGLGFVLATAALHGAGVALGLGAARLGRGRAARLPRPRRRGGGVRAAKLAFG